MQLLEDGPLELEESEMFEDELEEVGPAAPDPASLLLATEAPAAAAAVSIHTAQEEGESESDDDGIVLESECSSSDAEDEVEQELVGRIQSLQSSLDHPAPVNEGVVEAALSTSHSSQVGSLKTFAPMSFKGKRLFGSEGDLATSVPVRSTAPMLAARRRVAPAADKQPCNLGTSMPISIPMMQRRSSAADLAAAAEERVAAATFVPPHMLHRQDVERLSDLVSAPGGELGLSPSAKREKLLARNAILRSTGFIEVQHTHPPTMGEVLDPVKEQLLGAVAASGALAVPVARIDARATPRSSLTQMLGTSK